MSRGYTVEYVTLGQTVSEDGLSFAGMLFRVHECLECPSVIEVRILDMDGYGQDARLIRVQGVWGEDKEFDPEEEE